MSQPSGTFRVGPLINLALIVKPCHQINKLLHNPWRIRSRLRYLPFSLETNFTLLLESKSQITIGKYFVELEEERTFTCRMLCFDSSVPSFFSPIVAATMANSRKKAEQYVEKAIRNLSQNSKTTDLVCRPIFQLSIIHFPVFFLPWSFLLYFFTMRPP